MNHKRFLRIAIIATMLVPFFSYSNTVINSSLKIKPNTLTFFSSGHQIISNKNGISLKLDDGTIVNDEPSLTNHTAYLTNDMITRQMEANENTSVDFNKVVITRTSDKREGSEIILLFDNKGRVIESIDSLGDVRKIYYDNDGNRVRTESSAIGIIHHEPNGRNVMIEHFDGTKEYVTVDDKGVRNSAPANFD